MPQLFSSVVCPECGFPIAGQPGHAVRCPNCRITGTISGVAIPDPIFWGGLGIILGLVLSRSKIIASRLAKL